MAIARRIGYAVVGLGNLARNAILPAFCALQVLEARGGGESRREESLGEFVTHRFELRDVDTAVKKAIEPESMKIVLKPWR
jgi:predicted dehydrogenase